MTQVAELCELDDQFRTRRLARYLVATDNRIEIIGLAPGGAELARAMLEDALVDPFGRTVTQADGADFLKTLRWARSSDFLWVTPLVDVAGDAAADPETDLPSSGERGVPATVPYPAPPAGLAGIRVAEVRCPRPDDYTRTEVVARLVADADGSIRVEGPGADSVAITERALAGLGNPSLDELEGVTLAPGLMVFAAGFDEPGDRAWRDALVGTRKHAAAAGEVDVVVRLDLEFVTRLPRIWLSRCPFTGEVLRMAIDAWGFDSPFWDPVAPLRPLDDLPDTFLGVAGAIVDGSALPMAAAEALGAGRAPVFSTLIDDPAVRAVLSATWIGGHRCDLVAYFAQPGPPRISQHQFDEPRFNEWGTRLARVRDGSTWSWVPGPDADPPVVTDPGRHLTSGRLFWITPDDMGVELHNGPDGCPWLAQG